jgi:hypothetical protein
MLNYIKTDGASLFAGFKKPRPEMIGLQIRIWWDRGGGLSQIRLCLFNIIKRNIKRFVSLGEFIENGTGTGTYGNHIVNMQEFRLCVQRV